MSVGSVPALADPAPTAAASRSARWGDLRKRAISAALLAPLALLCIWLGAVPWTALIAVAAVGLGMEWANLCGKRALAWPGVAVPIQLAAAGIVTAAGMPLVAVPLLLLGTGLVLLSTGRRALAAGVLYVGLPLVALAWLRGAGEVGRANVLFVVLIVWASDIGAYLVGRMVGGPKLAPAISPGKTWSGAIGGLVIAMAVGEAAAHAFGGGLAPHVAGRAAAVACMLGVASAAGDLVESWIKRRFGVKDSGRLIPGHGGLLDRLDGLLAAAPAASLLALVLGHGEVLWN